MPEAISSCLYALDFVEWGSDGIDLGCRTCKEVERMRTIHAVLGIAFDQERNGRWRSLQSTYDRLIKWGRCLSLISFAGGRTISSARLLV